MIDLAIRFEDASDGTFYKILAALASMKGKGYVGKVKFEEKSFKNEICKWTSWYGEVQFLSKEALGIFGKKIRSRRK